MNIPYKVILLLLVLLTSCTEQKQVVQNNYSGKEGLTDKLSDFYENNEGVIPIESFKLNNYIFSLYKKDNSTGLVYLYNDSVLFVKDNFIPNNATCKFYIKDTANVVITYKHNVEQYKYIFNNVAEKWLLSYAEKKEITEDYDLYSFTNIIEKEFFLDGFSTNSIDFNADNLVKYNFNKKKSLDNIAEQVKNMRVSKIESFKHIFTPQHGTELINTYPVTLINVISLNNIAYYLEQAGIVMPAISILESIIKEYPNRIVSYLNLADALIKINLKVKAKENYDYYIDLMKKRGKSNEIPQRLFSPN